MGLFKKKKQIFSNAAEERTLHKNLDFTAAEQYKLLRANLEFTLPRDEQCPVIGVTSALRGESKSTTSINLAYVLAEKGSRVLLIDGDLRLPSIAKKLDMENKTGFTEMLIDKGDPISKFKSDLLENLYIIPSGRIPPNPSELLGSQRMKAVLDELKKEFDYIVLDLPPVNLVSDAISVSSFISGMIVIVREEYCEKKELANCVRQLRLSNVNVLGFVMACVNSGGGAYKYRYRKYGKYRKYKYYKYYHHESSEKGEG